MATVWKTRKFPKSLTRRDVSFHFSLQQFPARMLLYITKLGSLTLHPERKIDLLWLPTLCPMFHFMLFCSSSQPWEFYVSKPLQFILWAENWPFMIASPLVPIFHNKHHTARYRQANIPWNGSQASQLLRNTHVVSQFILCNKQSCEQKINHPYQLVGTNPTKWFMTNGYNFCCVAYISDGGIHT